MEFCEVCDNLLYFSEPTSAAAMAAGGGAEGAMLSARGEGAMLNKFCKNCGFTKQLDIAKTGAIRVAKTLYSEDDLLYEQYKNKYLRHDPTLQRVRDPRLRCPSDACTADKDTSEVMYVKYHPLHMRYFFCCDACGTMWRRD